jgi:hypothetical protein
MGTLIREESRSIRKVVRTVSMFTVTLTLTKVGLEEIERKAWERSLTQHTRSLLRVSLGTIRRQASV